MNQEVHDQFSS